MVEKVVHGIEHEALEAREAFLGLRKEGSMSHMIDQIEEHLFRIIESPMVSVRWRLKAEKFLRVLSVRLVMSTVMATH
jgi:hypothetical protein